MKKSHNTNVRKLKIKRRGYIYLSIFVIIAYFFNAWRKGYEWLNWTGFSEKTLWEWSELLIIPVTLAVVAIILETSERKVDREIALANQREMILQNYFDAMTGLILEKALHRGSVIPHEVIEIAVVKTRTTLARLDGHRKRDLIKFLSEIYLIQKIDGQNPIISLAYADLSDSNLGGIDLKGANLTGANMKDSVLAETDLSNATLSESSLIHAELIATKIKGADFKFANLSGAFLFDTDLSGAVLDGTIMPDGQKYDSAIHKI